MSSSVGRNSLIMAGGTAASRITGQLRTILLAWAMGTTGMAANAYQAGSMIPQVIFTLVSGGIFNAVLVPQIVRTLQDDDAETKLNRLITFAIVLLAGVTLIMACATPLLTMLYVNGDPDMMALTNAFTLWCMPQIFFYGLYTVLGQILAAKNHFATYAWSSVGANVISCAGFTLFIALFGRASEQPFDFWTGNTILLTAGTWTLGVAFQALILFVPLRRLGIHFRPTWGVRGIGLRSMGPVAAWSIGIVIVDQLVNIVLTRVTTGAPAQAEALYGLSQFDVAGNATFQNANTINVLPYSLIAVSVSTAVFPLISRAAAAHDLNAARNALSEALRNVGLIMCYFAAGFIVMPTEIALALLPSVSVKEAVLISFPLMTLACALPLTSTYLIIQRTFYAFEDGRSPFIFTVLQVVLQVAILLGGAALLPPTQWVLMMGISSTVSYLLSFPPLVVMLRRRFAGDLDGARITRAFAKAIVAALCAAMAGLILRNPVHSLLGAHVNISGILNPALAGSFDAGHMNWLQAVGSCALLGVATLGVYLIVLRLLKTDELNALFGIISRRFPMRNGRSSEDHPAR